MSVLSSIMILYLHDVCIFWRRSLLRTSAIQFWNSDTLELCSYDVWLSTRRSLSWVALWKYINTNLHPENIIYDFKYILLNICSKLKQNQILSINLKQIKFVLKMFYLCFYLQDTQSVQVWNQRWCESMLCSKVHISHSRHYSRFTFGYCCSLRICHWCFQTSSLWGLFVIWNKQN